VWLALLVVLLAAHVPVVAADGEGTLQQWRRHRREVIRRASLAVKDAESRVTFGLLVIPVDFADARFADPDAALADLAQRLAGDREQTLRGYFAIASGGRLDLRPVLAPLVHLPGERRDYSDRDLNGYFRTRALAREAITGAIAAGVDLRLADADGPDGVAGTLDDDGDVDGILVLHAAPGIENEPQTGWIQPLQYFLEEPIVQHGITASVYAVAAARDGIGIWAHETGHLLGLEDRYDPFLPASGGDAAGRGGLGIFSLMAAGAVGIGGGERPALPDAYSALQLGWVEVRDLVVAVPLSLDLPPVTDGRVVWRLRCPDRPAEEYFLLEVRGGAGSGPYDAAVPRGQLVVTHVDETVPEMDQSSSDPATRHLRVALVEADGDGALAAGLDPGSERDVFPGLFARSEWGPATVPGSDGYTGPTGIALTGITPAGGDSVAVTVLAPGRLLDWTADFAETAAGTTFVFTAVARSPLSAAPDLEVVPLGGAAAWGRFDTPDGSIRVELVAGADGWQLPEPVRWLPAPAVPTGATTLFSIRLVLPELDTPQTSFWNWMWRDVPGTLSFADQEWSERWQQLQEGEPGTSWQRWLVPAGAGLPAGPLLACTGPAADDGSEWRTARYTNGTASRLVSSPLRGAARWLRLLHWVDADTLRGGAAGDGAAVLVELAGGEARALAPVDGYPGLVDPRVGGPLGGLPAWVGPGPLDAGGAPLWREDILQLPAAADGWCRLHLLLASDTLWRGRGWLIRRLELVPAGTIPLRLERDPDTGLLTADWPADRSLSWRLEASTDAGREWTVVGSGTGLPVTVDPGRVVPQVPVDRVLLRLVVEDPEGGIVTPPLPATELPPARANLRLAAGPPGPAVRFVVESDLPSRLELFDLRGRRLLTRSFPAGTYIHVWDGSGGGGRRAAAGLYLGRLTTSTGSVSCRCLLLR